MHLVTDPCVQQLPTTNQVMTFSHICAVITHHGAAVIIGLLLTTTIIGVIRSMLWSKPEISFKKY